MSTTRVYGTLQRGVTAYKSKGTVMSSLESGVTGNVLILICQKMFMFVRLIICKEQIKSRVDHI
jgi:hypothetical protein